MTESHHLRFFRDAHGRIVLFQRPNLPAVMSVAALILAWMLSGTAERVSLAAGFGAAFTWAWSELFTGTTPFRRCLGAVTLAGLLILVGFDQK